MGRRGEWEAGPEGRLGAGAAVPGRAGPKAAREAKEERAEGEGVGVANLQPTAIHSTDFVEMFSFSEFSVGRTGRSPLHADRLFLPDHPDLSVPKIINLM